MSSIAYRFLLKGGGAERRQEPCRGSYRRYSSAGSLSDYVSWYTGIGLEGIGQYNFTNKSSLLLQLQLIHFSGDSYYTFPSSASFTSLALKGGYRIDFSPLDLYANFLIGVEFSQMFTPATLGIGKRLHIHDHFIDAGLEVTGGYLPHCSIRAVYSLLQNVKGK